MDITENTKTLNISIHELYKVENLSLRTLNICLNQSWKCLKDILIYYFTKRSFLEIRLCGKKSNEELEIICDKYFYLIENKNPSLIDTQIKQKGYLDETSFYDHVSRRTLNICFTNNLTTLSSIVKYFIFHKSFLNLNGAGPKVNVELLEICKLYKLNFDELYQYFKLNESDSLDINECRINSISELKLKLIQAEIEYFFTNLSKIGFKELKKRNSGDWSLINIYKNLIKNENEYLSIVKYYKKFNLDVSNFKNVFWSIIEKYNNNNKTEEELKYELILILIRKHFQYIPDLKIEYLTYKYNSFFSLLDSFIRKYISENKNAEFILYRHCDFINPLSKVTLEETAKTLHLTRERVRQIKNNIEVKFYRSIKGILNDINIMPELCENSSLNINDDIITIDKGLALRINSGSKTNFSQIFIEKIMAWTFKHSHFSLSSNIITSNISNFFSMENEYLIIAEQRNKFNYLSFLHDIKILKNSKNKIDLIYNFPEWSRKYYLSSLDPSMKDKIKAICNTLTESELNIKIVNNYFIIPRNTKKLKFEYIIEILDKENRPMELSEIFKISSILYPGLFDSISTIRGHCLKIIKSHLFYIGRQSTYGLKKWLISNHDLKGGTIRDLAEEYLSNFDQPQLISEVIHFIQRYRTDSSFNSIISNLRQETTKRFKFSEDNKIALERPKFVK